MPLPKFINTQRDFSAGELNADATRRDDTRIGNAGAREMRNWRILNSGALQNRPGRRAQFPSSGRVEEMLVAPGLVYRLCFDDFGILNIRDANGLIVKTNGGFAWTIDTVQNIVVAAAARGALEWQIVFTFPGMRPGVARWQQNGGWDVSTFAFGEGSNGILAPFYRLGLPGRPMKVTGSTGPMQVILDQPYFTPSMVGMRLRWIDSQIVLKNFINTMTMGAEVVQALPSTYLFVVSDVIGDFALGETFANQEGILSEIAAVNLPGANIMVNMLRPGTKYNNHPGTVDRVTGPRGAFSITGEQLVTTGASSFRWDEEIMSDVRGWPQSCFFDQNRLGFCDFPAAPAAIAWSRIGIFDDFLVGALPADPILELNSDGARVYHVLNKGDEFIFTNRGVYYIPISENNPLVPGSVVFNKIATDPVASVKPTQNAEAVLFLNAGRNRVVAIVPRITTQAVPYELRESSLYHSHLFKQPIAIAATSGDGTFAERYVFVLNGDGSLIVGRYDSGQEWVGWVPWTSDGTVKWISALAPNVMLTTRYTGMIAELLDDTQYLDGAILINNPPPAMPPPPGFGPLWHFASQTVELMDGVKPLGSRQVDAAGFLILREGDDFSAPTIMIGMDWQPVITLELGSPPPGESRGQRIKRRRISHAAVAVAQSTGFVFNGKRVPPWRIGENVAAPPPLREETVRFRSLGRTFDPQVTLLKDVPGPLQVLEITTEVTI